MRRFIILILVTGIVLTGCKKKTTEPSTDGSGGNNGGGNGGGGGTSTIVWENTYNPQNHTFDVKYFVKKGNQYFAYDFVEKVLVSFKEDGSGFQEKNLAFNVLWTFPTDFYDYGNGIVLLFEGERTIVDIDYAGNVINEIDYGYQFSDFGRPVQIVKVNDGYLLLLKKVYWLSDPTDSVSIGKLDLSGQKVFSKLINLPSSQKTYGFDASDMSILSDGGVLALITRIDTVSYLNHDYVNFIIKFDSSGNEIWRKQTQVFDSDYLKNVCSVSSGAFLDFGGGNSEFYFVTNDGNLGSFTLNFTPDKYIMRPEEYLLTTSDEPDVVFLVIFDGGTDLKGHYKILKFDKTGSVLDIKVFPYEELSGLPETECPHFFARPGTDGVVYVRTAGDFNARYLVYGKIR